MSADLETRVDVKLAAQRHDIEQASARVTDALELARQRWNAAKDAAEDAGERHERRATRANWQAWNDAEDEAERAQGEIHRLGAQHCRLAAEHDRLRDPRHRQRLIDQANSERERRERSAA